ncbi:MAG: serine/threonine-protein kinase [Candidatus Zixiibacteriota bacterium]
MTKYSPYILFLLITLFVVILYGNGFGPLDSLQQSLNDFLCRVTATDGARPNVVLVTIDGRTQDEYGAWPWNHDRIADLLAAIAGAEPKALAVDFELTEDAFQDSAGYTDILAGQLTWMENVVIPYDIALATFRSHRTTTPEYLFNNSITVDNPLGIMGEKSSLLVRKVFLPAEKLLESKPYLGFDYTMPDEDRVLRHQPLVMNYEGYYYPSLSLMAAATFLDVSPDQIKVIENKEILLANKRRIPIGEGSEFLISFPRANSFSKYSAADVLAEGFDFSGLKNKLVLIGVDYFARGEAFNTPVRPDVPELAIKATVMENIVNTNFLDPKRGQSGLILILLLVIGGCCAITLPQVVMMHRMIILGVAFIILVNVTYFLFSSFRIVPQTVYIALELLLFVAAAPFLESKLLGPGMVARKEETRKKEKAKAAKPSTEPQREVAVRQIIATEHDPESQPTTVLATDYGQFEDHQAIRLEEETEATTGTPQATREETEKRELPKEPVRAVSKPEIIKPSEMADTPVPIESREDWDKQEREEPETRAPDIRSLGRYQVTSVLGKGAMGTVYKGIDPAINRPVALKTIRLDFVSDPQEEAELKERLHREAQAAGKLSHPNIVTIYDVGSEGRLQYIAMEYLEGQTLEEMIKKKVKFNYRIIAQVITQICNALEYAHEQGIVHRDIKPANIMILKDYRVKVMDYGIARIDSSSMTKTGIAMGTPNYISPEQLRGETTDKRADIFSLGVVIYELLLGKRPFKGENLTSLIYSILHDEPEKPSNVNPQVPLLFDRIIDLALRKDPNDRYQKAADIAADLKDFVESFAVKG